MHVPLQDAQSLGGSSYALGTIGDDDVELYDRDPTAWELRMRWHLYSGVSYIVSSCWVRPGTFLIWKVLVSLWSVAIWIGTLNDATKPTGRFFAFLTNWNETFLTIYLLCSTYICARHYFERREDVVDIYASRPLSAVATSYRPSVFLLRATFYLAEHCFAWTCLVMCMVSMHARAACCNQRSSCTVAAMLTALQYPFALPVVCVCQYWTSEFPHSLTTTGIHAVPFFWNLLVTRSAQEDMSAPVACTCTQSHWHSVALCVCCRSPLCSSFPARCMV